MANCSPKVLQKGACKAEKGKNGVDQSEGWGKVKGPEIPGANDAVDWIELGNQPEITHAESNSVIGKAAKSTPKQVGIAVDLPFNFYTRHSDQDYLNYWMFGASLDPVAIFVFDGAIDPWTTGVETPPAQDTVFEDGSSSQYTYKRRITAKTINGELKYQYVFEGTVVPDTLTAATLTEVGGGAEVFTYSAASTQKYETVYELESRGKAFQEYLAAEQALVGFEAGDLKNPMMSVCKQFNLHDTRYPNSICRSFKVSIPVGDMAMYETNFLAYKQDLSKDGAGAPVKHGYGSDTWTYPGPFEDSETVLSHFQGYLQMGETFEDLQDIEMDTFSVSVDLPLQKKHTTFSGKFLAEPCLEGHYDIKLEGTKSRYASIDLQNWRDQNTKLFARVSMSSGFNSVEYLMKNVILTQAGPDDSEVAEEPIEGAASNCAEADDVWQTSGYLSPNAQIHKMPMLMRVINDNNVNQMFEN